MEPGAALDCVRGVHQGYYLSMSRRVIQHMGYARDILGILRPRSLRDKTAYAAVISAVAGTVAMGVSIPAADRQADAARNSRSYVEQLYHLDQEHTDRIKAALGVLADFGALSIGALAAAMGNERNELETGDRLQFPAVTTGAPPNPSTYVLVMRNIANRNS